MEELKDALAVQFPLRGEWMALNTPGTKIPSHGTDQLGQRYAFDFVQVDSDRKGMPYFKGSPWRHWFGGVPLKDCYCYGQEIFAPSAGEVIAASDGLPERPKLHLLRDLWLVLVNAFTFNPDRSGLNPILGNYVILKCSEDTYAFFAHFQTGSIAVRVGDEVAKGQLVGRVGHSGNSTAPHLHFHLMDGNDLLSAKGLPCVFERYELWQDGDWQTVTNSVPKATDRVRFGQDENI